jgi:peptide chain release factor 1
MLDKLEEIARRHAELVDQQADPAVAVDVKRSREVAKKVAELEPVAAACRDYRRLERAGSARAGLASDDPELRAMAVAGQELAAGWRSNSGSSCFAAGDPNDRAT